MDKRALSLLLNMGLIKKYDLNPESREAHEQEAIYREGKKIKLTSEERAEYWSLRLIKGNRRKILRLLESEEVVNPWQP